MAVNKKRKGHWGSRSFFGLKANHKRTAHSGPTIGVGDAAIDTLDLYAESSQASSLSPMSSITSSTVGKLCHHGSRLLSVVRLHGSTSQQANHGILDFKDPNAVDKADWHLAGSRPPAIGSPSLASIDHYERADFPSSNTTPTNRDSVLCPEVIHPSRTFSGGACPLSQLSAAEQLESSTPVGDPQPAITGTMNNQGVPEGLRRTRSIPCIAHQLSHKITNTFGNPTVVHRVHHCARPSIQSLHEMLVSDMHRNEKVNTQSSTEPSSHSNSSGAFLGGRSTRKTSLSSNVASIHYFRNKERSERFEKPTAQGPLKLTQGETRESSLDPIEEKPEVVAPTIVTVEKAANAKIFFETYFHTLTSMHKSPRSYRRHELEAHLRTEAFTAEQCQRERNLWALQETDQLRRTRILKSKSNTTTGRSGVSLAGFDVVKVLGKGSFGVVRLVRQRDSTYDEQPTQSSVLSAVQPKVQASREESINIKTSTIEILRSTIDGQRASQRREVKRAKKEVYAMKVIRKSDMLRNSQEGHLRAERDFLVASEKSQWVVPLIASFQDNTNLYLVMEYMVGGDFLGLLFRKDVLKEKKARWYVAEMILCVEEAHRLRWIHRDVKPDNFLISASGHLKISDFGLAFDGHWTHDQSFFNNHRQSLMEKLGIKVEGDSLDRKEGAQVAAGMALANAITGRKCRRQAPQTDGPGENEDILHWRNRCCNRKLARSVVGTSQYMAPEVIRGEPYDGRCDWWSIGIILYEVRYCDIHRYRY